MFLRPQQFVTYFYLKLSLLVCSGNNRPFLASHCRFQSPTAQLLVALVYRGVVDPGNFFLSREDRLLDLVRRNTQMQRNASFLDDLLASELKITNAKAQCASAFKLVAPSCSR